MTDVVVGSLACKSGVLIGPPQALDDELVGAHVLKSAAGLRRFYKFLTTPPFYRGLRLAWKLQIGHVIMGRFRTIFSRIYSN